MTVFEKLVIKLLVFIGGCLIADLSIKTSSLDNDMIKQYKELASETAMELNK